MTAPTSARFHASADTLATRVGDEIVLVHTGTDQIYVLNRTGARLWELLCANRDRAEIERQLLDEFEVAPALLASQVEELIASLLEGNLIAAVDDE